MGVKPENYPPFAAHFDANQVPTIMGVVGSAGTADTGGTAQPLPIGVDAATGAAYVYNLAPAGAQSNPSGGTLNRIGSIDSIGTMPAISLALNSGTISAGTISGTFLEVTGSAIAGTADLIASTDVSSYRAGVIQLDNTWVGSINVQTSNDGTSFVTNFLTAVNSPTVPVSNLIANNQYYFPLNGRFLRVRMQAFTSGTAHATLDLWSLPSIPIHQYVQAVQNGVWNVTGTVAAGTLTNLVTGTINALASGTITGGTLQNLATGTITALGVGTVGGKAASGAVSIANPVQIAGTDAGGTIYSPLVSTGGVLTTNLTSSGTLLNLATGTLAAVTAVTTVSNLTNGSINILTGTTTLVSTVTTVSNLTNGSVNLLTGTVNALVTGTIGGKAASGAIAVANPVLIAGTDGGGTVYAPLVTTAGAQLTGLTSSGTLLNLATGTLAAVTAVTTVSNLTNGSINILTGTTTLVSTVTTVSNLTNGSVNLLTGTVTRVSNIGTLESGTVKIDPTPIPAPLLQGTLGTAGGSFFGTLSAASGAGTKHYIAGFSVIGQSGTADVRILAGTVIQGTGVLGAGNVVPGGGYVRDLTLPYVTGTNSELIYHFVGAGTAFITINYWKGV